MGWTPQRKRGKAAAASSSESKCAFLVGTHTDTCTHHTDIHSWLHRATQADTEKHPHKDSTNSLILLPSLAEQDGCPLVRTYIHMCKVDSPSSRAQTVCPVTVPGSQPFLGQPWEGLDRVSFLLS